MLDQETGELTTSENLKVHPRMKELYKFFKYNGKLKDLEDYNPDILHIFSREVLRMIEEGEDGWQEMLPPGIPELMEKENLFGCNHQENDNKESSSHVEDAPL
jgi:hypothetical protein